MTARAFSMADKISLGRAFQAMMQPDAPDAAQESLGHWLRRHRQTEGALNRFWRLVIASALNADIESIAVSYASKIIRELFMNSTAAGSMGMSSVPLSELYVGAEEFLKQHGSSILYNTNVEAAQWDEETSQWEINDSQGRAAFRLSRAGVALRGYAEVIAASSAGRWCREAGCHSLNVMSTGLFAVVHLWFDREITALDHAVLLDREIHWMYNKGRLQPWRKLKGSYVELVVSTSRTFAALPREEAIAQSVRELTEFFPEVASARIEKAALIKEVRATFGVPPGIDSARPSAISPWPNCFPWPAIGSRPAGPRPWRVRQRSGHLAAEAICQEHPRAPARFSIQT